MEEMTFKVVNDEGVEIECEVLFTFEIEDTHKKYIVFTDNSIDENDGSTKVFAKVIVFEEDDNCCNNAKLLPVETEEEYDIIEYILERIQTEEGREELLSKVNSGTGIYD